MLLVTQFPHSLSVQSSGLGGLSPFFSASSSWRKGRSANGVSPMVAISHKVIPNLHLIEEGGRGGEGEGEGEGRGGGGGGEGREGEGRGGEGRGGEGRGRMREGLLELVSGSTIHVSPGSYL